MREHKEEFLIESMCRVFRVSRSGYYASSSRPESARAQEDRVIADEVQSIFEEHKGRHGAPRIHQELRNRGRRVSRKRVRKTMCMRQLRASAPRKRVRTTDSRHNEAIAPNLLSQRFVAYAPNHTWAGDITYIPTDEGWLYLAVFIDLFSRKVIGWSMSAHLDGELALAALKMALRTRRPGSALIVHSDRGVQYAAKDFRRLLRDWFSIPSMSAKGNCYDNAVSESFFATLKKELVHRVRYRTRDAARAAIFEYIESYYNRRRLHSSLAYLSPCDFEYATGALDTKEPMTVVNSERPSNGPCEEFSMVIGGSNGCANAANNSTNLCPL
jgi:transposase InsO family protein